MTKHIGLKTMNQDTALATGMLALPPLVIEGLEKFKGSFDRLCLQAGTSAIEAMFATQGTHRCLHQDLQHQCHPVCLDQVRGPSKTPQTTFDRGEGSAVQRLSFQGFTHQ